MTRKIRTEILLLSLVVGGCASVSGVPGSGRGGPTVREIEAEGSDALDTLAHFETKLLEHRRARTTLAAEVARDDDRCEDLYALTQSICEVKDKLCSLADDNRTVPEYAALCREAERECDEAQSSCERCQPTE